MRVSVLAVLASIGIPACGGPDPGPAARTAARRAPSLVAPASGPDDAIVATVEGRPVWGSCVAAQLRRGAADRRIALGQCIDFELLAQAAERAGLAGDREVTDETRRALVSRLVEVGFEASYRTPDDLRELVDQVVQRNQAQLDKPELRASTFVRIEVARTASAEDDRAAHALADRIAGALAGETGLLPSHLIETADRIAAEAGRKVLHADYRAATREGLVGPYGDALFAIPEVGQISRPARSTEGWDIILLTQLHPPKVYTRDEVAVQVFPELRRNYFQVWVNQIIRSLGVHIEVDKDQVARLDQQGVGR